MKTNTLRQAAITMAILLALTLIGGCRTAGKTASTETDMRCPQCQAETDTAPIEGLTYTTHACPRCKHVETDASKTSLALANYTSMDLESVQVCKQCQCIVMSCPSCSAK